MKGASLGFDMESQRLTPVKVSCPLSGVRIALIRSAVVVCTSWFALKANPQRARAVPASRFALANPQR